MQPGVCSLLVSARQGYVAAKWNATLAQQPTPPSVQAIFGFAN